MRKPYFKLLTAKIIFLILFASTINFSEGKEGIWIPATLQDREAEMRAMGLQMSAEQLYNSDGTGLNNAVVLFGKGCTGEVISPRGLVLTNHHCGYGTVQGLSSTQNDYFASGYWAQNNSEEIPCGGLTVTFIRKMENVSGAILKDLPDTLNDVARDSIISKRIKSLEKGYAFTTHMDAGIKPCFNGNQYWVTISETYRDIRLVGFPPNGIGTFGGDAENWSWPRHTGDFSLFRIYADSNNRPVGYSKTNKPYNAKKYFTLSTGGYKEGDFTMVYGFPAITQEYITSFQLNQVYSIIDPVSIQVRTKKLAIWANNMNASRDVFIKYTSKRAGVANGWKKWQGEVRGLKLNNVLNKKRSYEDGFQAWAVQDNSLGYADKLLPQLQANAIAADSIIKADQYIREAVLGIELIQQGAVLNKILQYFRLGLTEAQLRDTIRNEINSLKAFYRNYDAATDKQVFSALMPLFADNCPSWIPSYYSDQYVQAGRDYNKWADNVFALSLIADTSHLNAFATSIEQSDSGRILSDPAWLLYKNIIDKRNNQIVPRLAEYYQHSNYLNRLYMNGQMHKEKNKVFYPDANFTLRLSYGKIKGIDPDGPAGYSYQTTLDEAIALDDPNINEFRIPERLKELQRNKNYGRWAEKGTVPLAFIADNHTSGGNSGSPVLNAKGELIGINFDRVWEGTMSDYYFDDRDCRNISLDIRYTLFIIEKFGNAGWLLKEMKIAKT